jgi:hypothetical protein
MFAALSAFRFCSSLFIIGVREFEGVGKGGKAVEQT